MARAQALDDARAAAAAARDTASEHAAEVLEALERAHQRELEALREAHARELAAAREIGQAAGEARKDEVAYLRDHATMVTKTLVTLSDPLALARAQASAPRAIDSDAPPRTIHSFDARRLARTRADRPDTADVARLVQAIDKRVKDEVASPPRTAAELEAAFDGSPPAAEGQGQ